MEFAKFRESNIFIREEWPFPDKGILIKTHMRIYIYIHRHTHIYILHTIIYIYTSFYVCIFTICMYIIYVCIPAPSKYPPLVPVSIGHQLASLFLCSLMGWDYEIPTQDVIRFPAARVYRDWEHTHPNLRNHQTLNLNCKAPPTQTENVGTCCVPSRVIPVSVTPLR